MAGKLRIPQRTSQDKYTGPLTSLVDETFHPEGEPRRIYLLWKLEMGMSFPKRRGVSQRVCEACGQVTPPTKNISGPSTKDQKLKRHYN